MASPFWMEVAQGWLGVHENGADAKEIARAWAEAKGLKHPPDLAHDRYHWCSVFIGACLGARQFDLGGVTAMVRSWAKFRSAEIVFDRARGIGSVHHGRYGDIVLYPRGQSPAHGHGNFLVSQDQKRIQGLGGNQGDRVNIAPFLKSRVIHIIRPVPQDGVIDKDPPTKHDGSDFARALDVVLSHEGGYANHPRDPGGHTNKGVTFTTFTTWRRMRGLAEPSVEDLRAISGDEVEQIYRTLYWQAAKCDALESFAMRLVHFDTAVNQGVGRAIRFLQQALKVDVDGQFGPQTARAEDRADQAALLIEYAARRMAHYGSLNSFDTFGLGWSRRLMRTALPAYAALGDIDTSPEDLPQPDETRSPAAWLDDPEIQKLAAEGAFLMFDKLLLPIARGVFTKMLGPIDGYKSLFGLVLTVLTLVANATGVQPVEPSGTGFDLLKMFIEVFTSQYMEVGAPSLLAAGLADKARKAA